MKRWAVGFAVLAMLTMRLSASAELVSDDFDDGALDPAWQVVEQSEGAWLGESGGALNVGGSSGQKEGLIVRYGQALADVGTVRIDYNWVFCNDHKARVGLALFDSYESVDSPSGNGFRIKAIKHSSGGSQHAVDCNHYVDGAGTSYRLVEPAPLSGAFMIERDGNDFWVRYLDGLTWQELLYWQHDFGGTPIYPYLFTSNSNTNPSWQVELDNFQADVIPEPSTFALLGAGTLTLLAYGRRRRREWPETQAPCCCGLNFDGYTPRTTGESLTWLLW